MAIHKTICCIGCEMNINLNDDEYLKIFNNSDYDNYLCDVCAEEVDTKLEAFAEKQDI